MEKPDILIVMRSLCGQPDGSYRGVCEIDNRFFYWGGSAEFSTEEVPQSIVSAAYAKLEEEEINYGLYLCKTEAKKRIAATDWSVLPDVGLANTAEFETYRAALRELIKNPVADPVWPTEPEPVWS